MSILITGASGFLGSYFKYKTETQKINFIERSNKDVKNFILTNNSNKKFYFYNQSIEEVLKSCPEGAVIVDENVLPQGDDAKFFDAWEFDSNGNVIVNIDTAKAWQLKFYNFGAIDTAQKRQLNTLTGIDNTIDDATWLAGLQADRVKIAAATSTSELLTISLPT